MRIGTVVGLVGLAAGIARGDDCLWTQRVVAGPSARFDHAMAYDAARGRVVLFGGQNHSPLPVVFGDTWEWDGTAWTERAGAGPAPRWGHAMAYNPETQRVVLFGGHAVVGSLADTWEWDGAAWQLRPGSGPSARWGHAMAFDPVRHGVLVNGGPPAATDCWLWAQGSWGMASLDGPRHGAMATDTARNRVVFFGDCCFSGAGQTYEWNGFTWSGPMGPMGPAERGELAMAFDPARARTVLFGGATSYIIRGDTWEWSGVAWELRTHGGPSSRRGHAMAFDTARGRAVLFGGVAETVHSDTWEWNGSAAAAALVITQQPTFSVGPPGSSATLSVTATGNGPLAYQWRREGVPLVNGGSVSGANTATLVINPTVCSDSARYDVVMTDACGSGRSDPATIGVSCPPSPCYANCDSSTIPPQLNVNDYTCFLMRYAAGCSGLPECYANCDQSTAAPILNVLDFVCFMNQYSAACQ